MSVGVVASTFNPHTHAHTHTHTQISRLHALRDLHERAAQFSGSVAYMSDSQDQLSKQIASLQALVAKVGMGTLVPTHAHSNVKLMRQISLVPSFFGSYAKESTFFLSRSR